VQDNGAIQMERVFWTIPCHCSMNSLFIPSMVFDQVLNIKDSATQEQDCRYSYRQIQAVLP